MVLFSSLFLKNGWLAKPNLLFIEQKRRLERVKGFEPSTYTLARYRSTPELHPRLPAAFLAICVWDGKPFLKGCEISLLLGEQTTKTI